MENDLKEYREKLAKLSEQEKKLRDLYLHNLSSGTIQGPETGYPSIDKSWLKYEKRQNVNLNYKNMSMIDFAYENNKNNLDDEFLIYNQGNVRRSITYREFFKIVEQYAQCLRNDYLIKVDDKIGVPMPTTPESIFLLYSLITIGAVPVFNDVRKSQKSIVEWLKLFGKEPKLIFTYDGILNKIGNSLKEMSYKSTKIIPVSGIEFLSNDKKMKKLNNLMHIKSFCSSKINNYNTESFSDFQKKCEKYEKVDNFSSHYVAGKTAFIEPTSGTTGLLKLVELSQDTANYRVLQYMNNGMDHKRGEKYLDIIPIFITYGAIVGVHLPLCMGMKLEIIPNYDESKTINYLNKKNIIENPSDFTLTPAGYSRFIFSKHFSSFDMSNVNIMGSGGDGSNCYADIIKEEKIQQQNCHKHICNGYGGSEIGAPFATERNDAIKPGSVGIPQPGNNVIILAEDNKTEKKTNEIGKICMVADYPMNSYCNNDELTKKCLNDTYLGRKGIVLEDYGYVDNDGFLFVKGRKSNLIKGTIWPVDIESIAMSTRLLKICTIVPIISDKFDCTLFITPQEGVDIGLAKQQVLNAIEKFSLENNPNYNLKINIESIEWPLLTDSGKINRKEMQELAQNLLDDNNKKRILKK